MQVDLGTIRPEMGIPEGFGRKPESGGTFEATAWSFAVRLGLAVAAISAAYFLMTAEWPAALMGRVLGHIRPGYLPGPAGRLFAGLG